MPALSNSRHELFAQEMAKGLSQSDAYIAAGYSASTPDAASANAARLIGNDKVAARISELQSKVAAKVIEKIAITEVRVLEELALLGFANMQDYIRVGPDGDPYTDFSALTREQAAAIGEVTVEDFKDGRGASARDVRRVKFKISDKRAALVDIGKHLGMFKERVEHSGSINLGLADRLEKARKRGG